MLTYNPNFHFPVNLLDSAYQTLPKTLTSSQMEDYIFLLLFEQRQRAIGFIAIAIGTLYGLTLALIDRDSLHFMFGIVAVLMLLVNANQAGLPLFGNHPKISVNGKHVGFMFTPFWAIVAALNWLDFSYTLA